MKRATPNQAIFRLRKIRKLVVGVPPEKFNMYRYYDFDGDGCGCALHHAEEQNAISSTTEWGKYFGVTRSTLDKVFAVNMITGDSYGDTYKGEPAKVEFLKRIDRVIARKKLQATRSKAEA